MQSWAVVLLDKNAVSAGCLRDGAPKAISADFDGRKDTVRRKAKLK